MDSITQAQFYATTYNVVHKHQMYGVLPYTHHLQAVDDVLKKYGPLEPGYERWLGEVDETGSSLYPGANDMRTAAWLHDIVEDTDIKLRDIEENFGLQVAKLVGAVTSEEGPSRKVRNALTYPKIRDAGRCAVRLKLADRIANVSSGGASVEMYRKEHNDFHRALFTDGENVDMWVVLNELVRKRYF